MGMVSGEAPGEAANHYKESSLTLWNRCWRWTNNRACTIKTASMNPRKLDGRPDAEMLKAWHATRCPSLDSNVLPTVQKRRKLQMRQVSATSLFGWPRERSLERPCTAWNKQKPTDREKNKTRTGTTQSKSNGDCRVRDCPRLAGTHRTGPRALVGSSSVTCFHCHILFQWAIRIVDGVVWNVLARFDWWKVPAKGPFVCFRLDGTR